MNKIVRKIGVVAVVLATIVSVIPASAAQTPEQLQAQINTLLAQIATLQAQLGGTTAAPAAPVFNFTRDLTLGARGEDVKALQQFLNAQGFPVAATGPGSAGNETTHFGPRTRDALARFQAANNIGRATGFFGPLTRARIATMAAAPAVPTTPVAPVIAPMSVTLAADNPVAANLQRGSANNNVLRFVLTGGATPVSVTGITLTSYGTTEASGSTHIPAVRLFDENGVQIGNDRTPTGNQVNFVIVPALTIPANGSRTITVAANIGTAVDAMTVVRYGFASAAAISGAAFTGQFPVIGNSFTIVPAGQLGGLTVSEHGTLPRVSVRTGDRDVVLERFNVSAGANEDISVNQVVVTRVSGTDTNMTNLRLRRVGETGVLAGPATFSNRRVTFNLLTPVNLTRGTSVNLEVIGDVNDAVGGPISVRVDASGVVGRGATSGTNIASVGTTTANNITLGTEQLIVSMAATHPQGAAASTVRSVNRRDLAHFDVQARGGSVILSNVVLDFAGVTGNLTSVGIFDGDALISDLINVADATQLNRNFALNYTIPAGTTRTLVVRGITSGLTTNPNNINVSWDSATGSGLASGETVTSTTNVATSNIVVHPTGAITLSADTDRTPRDQAILAPSMNVTVGSLRVFAQREDMRLNGLQVNFTGTGLDAGEISSITLFAEDGTTQLTNAIHPAAIGQFIVQSDDILQDIVFTRDVRRTIFVRANIGGGAAATAVRASIPSNTVRFVGQASGTPLETNAVADLHFASPFASGTFSLTPEVITIQRAATSPSGTVSRAVETDTAIFDVRNESATQTSDTVTSITFTSRRGLPSGAVNTMFRLYDGNVRIDSAGTNVVDVAAGTVAFNTLTLAVAPAETRQLRLVVDTTSTTVWASGAEIQWAIETVGAVVGANAGFAAGVWTIPAVANNVRL